MADQNFEIDIEAGRDDDEMQVDEEAQTMKRRGRGFRSGTANHQPLQRRAEGVANPSHATAVRCMLLPID